MSLRQLLRHLGWVYEFVSHHEWFHLADYYFAEKCEELTATPDPATSHISVC